MADVQALCKRVIVIHHGRILFDGALAALADQFAATKTINVTLLDGAPDLSKYGEVLGSEDGRTTIRVSRADAPRVTTKMLRELPHRRPHDRGPADRGRDRARVRERAADRRGQPRPPGRTPPRSTSPTRHRPTRVP